MTSAGDPEHCYSRAELKVFDLLKHPVWVFDADNICMYWANKAAVKIWRADTLDELLARDYASDLSVDRAYKLKQVMQAYAKGEVTHEEWTFYPNGVATQMQVTGSGIRLEGGRMAMLQEAELPDRSVYDESAVRGVELLRRLPLAVCQFSIDGKLIYQNPEALHIFGIAKGDFKSLFVDQALGDKVFEEVSTGKAYDDEAEHHTETGSGWFSISARKTRDPVTSAHIILLIARDITEIVQARKDKAMANFKSEFMAILAHDIRTPLHQIVGYMDLLELSGLSEGQLEQVRMVQVSAAVLMAISNDLLDYSKLESGKLQIENACFKLQDLLNGCIAAAVSEANEKGLQVISDIASDLPTDIIGDPDRLRQVLINLLNNGVKFTEQGSVTLKLCLVDENRKLRFEIADTGIGIERSQQENLFVKYRQANTSIARNYGGTGLGLAICKGLVETMGGTIALRSELNKGTVVFFEIALQIPDKPSQTGQVAPVPVEAIRPMRVLVAEDNKINQKVIRAMLQRIGHVVTIAENGRIAVDRLQRESFDLVLMDVQMPVMDGIEATKKIRSIGFSKSDLAIVGLTASFQQSELDTYLGIGMNDCLGKPVKLINLKRTIEANRSAKTSAKSAG
jgi:signal transduction histidine kinase/CheY-like chemotaxis protein